MSMRKTIDITMIAELPAPTFSEPVCIPQGKILRVIQRREGDVANGLTPAAVLLFASVQRTMRLRGYRENQSGDIQSVAVRSRM